MSNTTGYATAVAAVRALESSLLSKSDIDRLTAASKKSEIADILTGSGKYTLPDGESIGEFIDSELERVWNFISGYAPGDKALSILLYRNDFHNLKAALKALIMNSEPQRYFITPTNLDLGELCATVTARDFGSLPEYMSEAAEKTYGILTETLDGQLADACVDCAAMRAMQLSAEEAGSGFMKKYAALITVGSDIKTAYRCSRMNKSALFAESAICGSTELDKASLVNASLRGTESFLSWLSSTAYAEAAEKLSESTASFEKYCDDMIISLAEEAKLKAFGVEPLAAYFIAKETEIKNLRILVTCKEFGADNDIITERMRKLYV
ncbi:MAG: V-type ATPase subunit [Ruminococcus sp.]|nr:V-type ATPase subunit [Oscillospiraceae bacterium]